MTNGNGFYLTNTSTGALSADTKGTTISNETESNTITESVTFKWTPTSSYNAAGTKTVTKSATGSAVQAGNYVTGLTVTTTCTFSGTIPASGGSISDTGGDASITAYKFSSGASSSSSPGSTYGTSSKSTTWSMTNGNGFTLNDYTVTAADRGTTTGSSRNSNTITETATATWTPKSPYNEAGTITATATDTDYCVQEANEYTYQVGVVNVTSPKGKIDEIDAGGGTATATQSAWQAMASGYTATGLNLWTNTTFTWYYNKSNNAALGTGFYFKSGGGISASSRGNTTGNARTSSTVTVYAGANGTTGNATYYATQEANSMSESYGNITITSPSGALNDEFAASGGTQTPTFSAWQACSRSYTSGSGSSAWTNTTFTWTFDKSNGASLGTGFYFKTGGAISADSRGTTTGTTRTSNNVTATATANGKSKSTTYYATQEDNEKTLTYGSLSISGPSNGANTGTIPASGGSIMISTQYHASQTWSSGYTSGEGSGSGTIYPAQQTVVMTNTNGFTLYYNGNWCISADTRGTTTGAKKNSGSYEVRWNSNGYTATRTGYVSQEANTLDSWSSATVNVSFSYSGTIPASGGTKSPTLSRSGSMWPKFTSGSYGGRVYVSAMTPDYHITSGSNGITVNASTGVVTATNNSDEAERSATIALELAACGETVVNRSATVYQSGAIVYVTVASSSSVLNGGRYYGSILQNSNGSTQLSSDYTINVGEEIACTGFTATQGPAGSLSCYGSNKLTRCPSMTITKNGTTILSNLAATTWSSQQASWHGGSVNTTINVGDVIVATITV